MHGTIVWDLPAIIADQSMEFLQEIQTYYRIYSSSILLLVANCFVVNVGERSPRIATAERLRSLVSQEQIGFTYNNNLCRLGQARKGDKGSGG